MWQNLAGSRWREEGAIWPGQAALEALCHKPQRAAWAAGHAQASVQCAGSIQDHLPVTRMGGSCHWAIPLTSHMFKDHPEGGRAASKHRQRRNRGWRGTDLWDSLRCGRTPISFCLVGLPSPCHFTCGPSPLTAGTAILILKFSCSFASLHTTFSACSWLMLPSKGQTTSGFCSVSALLPDLLGILRPRCKIKSTGNLRRQEFQPKHLAKTTRDHERPKGQRRGD